MNKKSMCIVGFGRMGKRCAKLFSGGFSVDVVSQQNIHDEVPDIGVGQSTDERKSLSEADFVILAVPIVALDSWIPKINKLTKPECVVIDCSSVRDAVNEKLLQLKRKHYGMPEVGSKNVRVDGNSDELVSRYLQERGCSVVPANITNSDGKPVAGLIHFVGMALDINITDEERSRMADSPACRYMLQLIEHLKSNSPSTYRETQLLDPRMSQRGKELIGWLKSLDAELDRGVFRFKPYARDKWRE